MTEGVKDLTVHTKMTLERICRCLEESMTEREKYIFKRMGG